MPLELPPGLTLYFARHGQTEANVEHRFSGYKDTPLTPLGLKQAAQVGRILKRELGTAPGYQFISSPLARAVATMKIARQTMALYLEPDRGVLPKAGGVSLPGMAQVIAFMEEGGVIKSPAPGPERFVDVQYLKAAGVE